MKATRIRPITIMAALGVVALAAAAFAWVEGGSDHAGPPELLPIGAASSAAGGTAQADIAMAPAQPSGRVVYVAAPGLPALGASLHAWRVAGPKPDATSVRRLGAALGSPIRVTQTGLHSWSWSFSSSSTVTSPPIACARPLPVSNGIGPDDSVASPCGHAPHPPADVPDATAAERHARELLGRAGVDLRGWKVTASTDGYSATVTAAPALDGVPVEGLSITLTFGSHAAVTYASGFFGAPQRADAYPLIGTRAAVAQLAKGEVLGSGIVPMMGGVPVPAWSSGTAVSNGVAEGSAPATTWVRGSAPAPSTEPGSTEPGSTEPVPSTSLAPVTVTIDRAQLVLSAQLGTDGAVWLVPAYRLTASGSVGSWTVLAVDRHYVAPPVVRPPVATIEPPGFGSGSSSGSSASSPGTGVGTPGSAPAPTTSTATPPKGG